MDLIEKIKKRLSEPLPGREAQYRMAHLNRQILEFDKTTLPPDVRVAAVLVLLFPDMDGESWHLSLIRRTADNHAHSKQVGFPGGGKEDQDNDDLQRTALRETWEEVGVHPDKIEILGQLTELYIPVSKNLVYPFVGVTQERPIFQPDPKEVEHVIEVPVHHFSDPSNRKTGQITMGNGYVLNEVPYFDVYGNMVWGATAMMLSELNVLLQS